VRRCSENAFGILGARFQIFRAAMRYDLDRIQNYISLLPFTHVEN